MPAAPEGLNVRGKKWQVKIGRSSDPQQITEPDRECAVAGEVEEQIEAVAIHVRHHRQKSMAVLHDADPAVVDNSREDKLVEQPGKQTRNRMVEIIKKFGDGSRRMPIGFESTVAIQRPRRDCGEKEQEN